ncbi:type IV pilus modification protein PilV [Herminiimonas fonticola]|uniref:Type IV pilus assembly protein PilV n=1 Tax=Herminiimonas fonticola TaxID=303380 RepID=A0A4R6G811_9BURK|nr:type IV pilus modification protein PilV [Herminiimonas fonticola]RBA23934.1 type IV pilus modification protein PilV [Herminiimonas fonticola]TDN89934.1 type IV pilus assembly protein PilV [Herminiimonas fonticola]
MRSTEHGFSLIEVLVSVFILAVGVIGALGMHLNALRTAQQSAYQTRALHLGADMVDAMRANVEQMRLPDNANPYLQVDYQSSPASSHSSNLACYGSNGDCNTQELARFEIDQFLRHIDADFPGGRVRICRDALPWNAKAEHFEWDCAIASSALVLAPLVIKIGWQEKNLHSKTSQVDSSITPSMVLTVASYSR